ncbi:DUF7507 domain-containing protein [Arcanobacterium bovis]|uniref:Uncharacterized protein n=1 Tax=Arcanobacterium bovis TaxID=2529275 RepID=A0A4Q9V2F0_9ACTO|nr:SdrD B-like domain-containing protein [Arcanobacterium bovis]TBW23790.1 hypothetical protein EZJ44_01240 [Arcanobacterium bovis]
MNRRVWAHHRVTILTIVLVIFVGMGIVAPITRSYAGVPEVTAKLVRTYTGTQHGTSWACVLNSANGITPGDDSAADDIVCTGDTVGFSVDINIKSDATPTPFKIAFPLGMGDQNAPYGSNTYQFPLKESTVGVYDICKDNPGVWTGKAIDYIENGKQFYACQITPAPNINAAYHANLTLMTSLRTGTVSQPRVLVDTGAGYTTAATAQPFTVIGKLEVDLLARPLTVGTSAATTYRNGKLYYRVPADLSIGSKTYNKAAYSANGRLAITDPLVVNFELLNAPAGSIFENGTAVNASRSLNGGNYLAAFNGSNIDLYNVNAILVPVDAVAPGAQVQLGYRIAQSTPAVMAADGSANWGGTPQPGTTEALCTTDTKTLGGVPSRTSSLNNDCSLATVVFNQPGVLFSKSAGGTYKTMTNATGVPKNYSNVVSGNDNFRDYFTLQPNVGLKPVVICDAWDPAKQQVTNMIPTITTVTSMSDAQWAATGLDPSQYIKPANFKIEYSSQQPKTGCGSPSETAGWYTDPAQVPGGRTAVNSVRIVSKNPVAVDYGMYVSAEFTPVTTMTPFDEWGVSGPNYDYASVSLDSAAWNATAAAYFNFISYSGQINGTSITGPTSVQLVPGSTFTATAALNMNVSPSTLPLDGLKVEYKVDPCTTPLSAGTPSADWTYTITPGAAAGGPGCEDDIPGIVTFTPTRTLTAAEVVFGGWGADPSKFFRITMAVSPLITKPQITVTTTPILPNKPLIALVPGSWNFNMTYTAALTAQKAADFAMLERDSDISWTLSWRNSLTTDVSAATWIDVLPYNGDAQGSKLNGTLSFTKVAVPAGVTVEYTKTPGVNVVNDPADASNQAGGATVWCAGFSGGTCPASAGEVTALRFVDSGLKANTGHSVQIFGYVNGGLDGDVLINRLGVGRAQGFSVVVPSPDPVTTRVVASEISGLVWHDVDRNATVGATESHYAGVELNLLDNAGNVVATTTTKADGTYAFNELHSGTYYVQVAKRNSVPADAIPTYRYDNAPVNTALDKTSAVVVGMDKTVPNVNFGFAERVPAVSLVKEVQGQDGQWYKNAPVIWGNAAKWRITVKNTGETTLTALHITDPQGVNCERDLADLAMGESTSFECSTPDVHAALTNKATVNGTGNGIAVSANDTASVTVTGAPAFALTKDIASVTHGSDPTDLASTPNKIFAGDVIHYTIKVTNTGNVPLMAVTITDADAENLSCAPSVSDTTPLAVGASVDCTATHTVTVADILAGQYTNVAAASVTSPPGLPSVPDQRDDAVQPLGASPVLTIVKTADVNGVADDGSIHRVGDAVLWRFKVTNTGNVPVANITVEDPEFTGTITCEKTSLNPGESTPCAATVTTALTLDDAATGYRYNSAIAHGDDRGTPVASLKADVKVLVRPSIPGISIAKDVLSVTRNGGSEDLQSTPALINPGDVVTWKITVGNSGDVALKDVTITDTNVDAATIRCPQTTLAVGEKMDCEAASVVKESDILAGTMQNTASVHGVPVDGTEPPADPSDDAVQPLELRGSIGIVKSHLVSGVASDEAQFGQSVQWRFTVTNTSNVTLHGVEVHDQILLDRVPDAVIACEKTELLPGDTTTCVASDDLVTKSDARNGRINNTATASGIDPKDTQVNSAESKDSVVILPLPPEPVIPPAAVTPPASAEPIPPNPILAKTGSVGIVLTSVISVMALFIGLLMTLRRKESR